MYSIGYATKAIQIYIEQLQHYEIDVVVDVRSVPYSKVFYDFHQPALTQHLRQANIRYLYLGLELGPRSKDLKHYDKTGQVQFDRLMQSDLFQTGIARLAQGIDKGFTIALTCAEKDPAICHRSLLVGWYLQRHKQIELQHILHDGELETQNNLERRLISLTNSTPDLLTTEEEALAMAYRRQCFACAYRIPEAHGE